MVIGRYAHGVLIKILMGHRVQTQTRCSRLEMLVRYIGHKNSNDSSVKTKNLRRNIYHETLLFILGKRYRSKWTK